MLSPVSIHGSSIRCTVNGMEQRDHSTYSSRRETANDRWNASHTRTCSALTIVRFISDSEAGLMPQRSATRTILKRRFTSSLGVTSFGASGKKIAQASFTLVRKRLTAPDDLRLLGFFLTPPSWLDKLPPTLLKSSLLSIPPVLVAPAWAATSLVPELVLLMSTTAPCSCQKFGRVSSESAD